MSEEATEPQVLISREGSLVRVTLNRPRVLNALNIGMVEAVDNAVSQSEGATAVLLDSTDDRGFCGGGDIKSMSTGLQDGLDFLAAEYRTDYAVHTSRVPVVGLMHGITMGGGIGLTGHAAVRVVTETSRVAMPETRIGIMPDVGGHRLLAAAPGRLGELLAITSGSMTAGDAIALGFADYFVPVATIEELRRRLADGEEANSACAAVAETAPESVLLAARDWFDPIADAALGDSATTLADPVAAAQRLIAALEASDNEQARSTAATVRGMCPTSVVVTLAELARTRLERPALDAVLAADFRVAGRMMARGDFAEGVRALLIDRDNSPKWSPATLEDVASAEIAAILDPDLAEGETRLEF